MAATAVLKAAARKSVRVRFPPSLLSILSLMSIFRGLFNGLQAYQE